MQTRVLVVSASMGAGHDGAARELVRRLKAEGHEAEMRDFLTSPPLRIGVLLKSSYEFQMKYMAWSYDLTYRLLYRAPALCPPIGRFMTRLTGTHLVEWARDFGADVVVSTYPLTSVVLGELRKAGRLDVPTINFITDFGVHPLWTHPGIDLNLAVHPHPAAKAEAKSGRPSIATGPMVSSRFAALQDRAATRASLGLSARDRAVLIVSGSWGVGDVSRTFRIIADSKRFVPVAVCGQDQRLRERLSRIAGGRALGWRDDMPALMAAADALVENAGGLTAMEALSVGLPIISFRPIAGHGKENTAEMQDAGVSRVARNAHQLLALLDDVTAPSPARQAMVAAGKAMFVADPARYVQHAAVVGAARLADRDLLAAVAAGYGEADIEHVSGVADRVDFDPAEELRALLAETSDDTGDLAPIVPIGSGRAASRTADRTTGAEAVEPAEVAALAPTGTDAEPADVVAIGINAVTTPDANANANANANADGGDDADGNDSDKVEALRPTGTGDGGRPPRGRPRRPSVAVARVAALVAVVPLVWAALTSGVGVATAYGAGVAHPRSNSGNVAYVGVRLSESQLNNPVIGQELADLNASAVVDEQTAAKDPVDIQRLVGLGVDVENGGAGPRVNSQGHRIAQVPWTRANGDVAASQELARIAGQPVKVFVPGRRLNAFDLMACYGAHNKSVVPDRILEPADEDPLGPLTARHTYLVNGAKSTDQQLQDLLSQLSHGLKAANLAGAPLADLV
ncbi:MAG: hypothetical protein QOF20_1516 [Acidimicrobiaceae bacterium]|nr:hypothetical protein [Acidimicrobiaceae bacterium]